MPTIQVRDIPEDVHATYRERAAAAGMSLQEYLRGELIRNARLRTPDDVVREIETRLRVEGDHGFASRSSAAAIRRVREGR